MRKTCISLYVIHGPPVFSILASFVACAAAKPPCLLPKLSTTCTCCSWSGSAVVRYLQSSSTPPPRMLNTGGGVSYFNTINTNNTCIVVNTNNTRIVVRKSCISLYCIVCNVLYSRTHRFQHPRPPPSTSAAPIMSSQRPPLALPFSHSKHGPESPDRVNVGWQCAQSGPLCPTAHVTSSPPVSTFGHGWCFFVAPGHLNTATRGWTCGGARSRLPAVLLIPYPGRTRTA